MDEAVQAAAAPWAGRRVAIVHDWLTGMRGGEKVLESICRLAPDADLFTLVHRKGSVSPLIEGRRVRTSFVQRLIRPARLYRHYLPLFPAAVEQFDLDDVDLVISTSHCAAKSVVATGRARHLCYCHSPMRYVWDQFDAYFGPSRIGAIGSAAMRPIAARLARWDRDTAHRVSAFVANSHFVAGRIGRYYNRRAAVVHPPVDTGFFTPGDASAGGYFLVVSALVPYKRIDVAIAAARRLRAPLKIVGTGPDAARLRALAGADVEFLGSVSPTDLRSLYRGARALVHPGEEDFGIAPVEALACGRPVVAYGRGGVTETVDHGVTGVLVPDLDPGQFADAMAAADTLPGDAQSRQAAAARFGVAVFEAALSDRLSELASGAAW